MVQDYTELHYEPHDHQAARRHAITFVTAALKDNEMHDAGGA